MNEKKLCVLTLLLCIVTSTLAGDDKCFPPCRSGYFCHEGTCINRCNPPCPEGYRCNDNSECEEEFPSASDTESIPEINFSRHYTVAKLGRVFHSIGSPLSYGSTVLTIVWLGLHGGADELIPVFAPIGGTGLLLNQVGVQMSIVNAKRALNNTYSPPSDRRMYQEFRRRYITGQVCAIASLVCVTGTTPLGYNTHFGASIPLYMAGLTFMVLRDINWAKMNRGTAALLKGRGDRSQRVRVSFGAAPIEQNGLQWSLRVGIGL